MTNCYWCGTDPNCKHLPKCDFCNGTATQKTVTWIEQAPLNLCDPCYKEFVDFYQEQMNDYHSDVL